MLKTAISAFALVLATTPAIAANFNGAKAVCAEAIAAKNGKGLDGAKLKLLKARDGAIQRVTVAVAYLDGATAIGECKVRRGEVQSLEVQS